MSAFRRLPKNPQKSRKSRKSKHIDFKGFVYPEVFKETPPVRYWSP